MDILSHSLDALWRVSAVAFVLGAGLPALFALGLRSLSAGREAGSHETDPPTALGKVGAFLCFGVVVAAALFGLVVIVFGGQLFG